MTDTVRYKQLEKQYQTLCDDKDKIDILVNMAVELRTYDVEKASTMADEIIKKADDANYQLGKSRALNLKGSCFWLMGLYDSALEILPNALAIADRVKDRHLEARILNNFGNIYRDKGDLAEALNYFERALRINEERGDEVAQSVNLTSISNLHYDLNDYDTALEYALKSLPIFERAQNPSRLITIYHALGNIYFKQEAYHEALKYFEENLRLSEPNTSVYVMAVSGLGKVYYKMRDFENAKKYLFQALHKSEELGNVEVQIIGHYYLGSMFMDQGNLDESLRHVNAAGALAEEYSRRHDMMSVHEMLSCLYDKMGDIVQAYQHLKAFEQLKEEIFKQKTINKLRSLQIRQQMELARKEKEVAERTANLKQQFMANMSHEIRTPMNAIVGMTRLLLTKNPQPDQLKYLTAIKQSADNLLVIINDILDLSKIEAGKIVIEHTDFSIRDVAQSVHDMLMLKAEEKGIEMKVSLDPDIPYRLTGDPTRINQILINLAGNAIKFTEKGYVEINISLKEKQGNHLSLQFDVADTGIGISPDYINKIFESFTQAGSDVARKFGGTGLGLTITKQLVMLMGGDISVSSEPGRKTIFSVVVPFAESAVQDAQMQQIVLDNEAMGRLSRIRVLLVEDNEFNRILAEDTLHDVIPGVRIDVATDGREAVKMVAFNHFDIVLMDIQMPVMDGVSATKAIRALAPPSCDVKIIAMTANVLQEDVQKYLDVGMNGYVSKPFQPDELLLGMASVLNYENQGTKEDHQLLTYAVDGHVTDMQFLKDFTGGRIDKMRKYIGMFLENAPRLLDEIDNAIATQNYQSLKIAAHSLKPQLSYMGIKEDVSNIFIIEQSAGEPAHRAGLPRRIFRLRAVCNQAFNELKQEEPA